MFFFRSRDRELDIEATYIDFLRFARDVDTKQAKM
jgi:hypothetical protein